MTAAKTKLDAAEGESLFDKLRRTIKEPDPIRVTDEIVLTCPTKKQLEDSQKASTEEESNRILIGDKYDALVALFDNEPPHRWAEFNKVYLNHFFDIPIEPSS